MTEYDYSPGAVARYKEKMRSIANWVDQTRPEVAQRQGRSRSYATPNSPQYSSPQRPNFSRKPSNHSHSQSSPMTAVFPRPAPQTYVTQPQQWQRRPPTRSATMPNYYYPQPQSPYSQPHSPSFQYAQPQVIILPRNTRFVSYSYTPSPSPGGMISYAPRKKQHHRSRRKSF